MSLADDSGWGVGSLEDLAKEGSMKQTVERHSGELWELRHWHVHTHTSL